MMMVGLMRLILMTMVMMMMMTMMMMMIMSTGVVPSRRGEVSHRGPPELPGLPQDFVSTIQR